MSAEFPETPPQMQVLELATASWVSAAVSAAAALGIADELASGARSPAEIATAVDAHAPTLYRLMRACADLGLFRELEGRFFELTELGEVLRSDIPSSIRNFVIWSGLPAERYSWAGLPKSVRTGKPAFQGVHGQPIWDYMRNHPNVSEVFDQAMTEISALIVPRIVEIYDFSTSGTVVDIGGGQGGLLAAVLAVNPRAHGMLYDQPEVIAGAGKALKEAGVSDRCELIGGDFFESVPAGGDIYLLSNILHDWDDEQSARILANCRAAMKDDSRLLLIETVMPDNPEPSPMVKLMDLDMLVLCGGCQRTEAEFRELLQRVGLKLARIIPGDCSVVEAVRE